MRIRGLKSLLSVLVLFVALPAAGQSKDVAQRVDEYLSLRTDLGRFSGAVLIARDGKVLLRKGYGFADVEKKTPYTPETRQDVASISKMFTAMAALKLRDQGKLRLEDPVCKYLEDCPETWKPITIQQLMRHTSGIPDYEEALEIGSGKYMAFMNQPGASAKIVENARKLPLDFKPGEKFHYSNTGYIVLSYAVQKAAGQPFGDFVTRTLLAPAGMTRSGIFGVGDGPKSLATGYTHSDLGWDKMLAGVSLTAGHLRKVPQLPLTPPEGDAGIYSTVDDLYRWSQVMDGGPLVSAPEAAEVFTPGLENYGYGWFIDTGFDRQRMRHTGLLPGYVSDFIKFPGDKVTIILFSNLDRTRLDRIARDVTAIVLGKPYDLPVHGKVVQLTAEQFAKLEGDYKMTDGKLLTVRKQPDLLTAEIKGRYMAGLIPLSPTELYFPLGDGKAVFTLDESGKAVKVNMRYGGEDHVGERVAPQP
ncbi:MAG: beta-lactamase family protein [Acidobacteria bacterium]|nr:beta-lactamase family protein [Acidobacteriota bacterium]